MARGDRSGDGPGDFERYALVAALTLLVLCILVADRGRDPEAPKPPPKDRLVHVLIGEGAGTHPPSGATSVSSPAPLQAGVPRSPAALPAPAEAPPRTRETRRPRRAPAPTFVVEDRTYTVRKNDTLSGIARRELGDSRRALEIARLNGLPDPDHIRIGQVLRLPMN